MKITRTGIVQPGVQIATFQRCGYCGFESPPTESWGCRRCGRCTPGQFTLINRPIGVRS